MGLFLGLRSPRNRSLLDVNEDFEDKHNDKRALLGTFVVISKTTYLNKE